jgi:hypothetical protein
VAWRGIHKAKERVVDSVPAHAECLAARRLSLTDGEPASMYSLTRFTIYLGHS